MHAVDVAVEHTYVIVARVHQRTVDGDAVGVVEVVDYQLAVIHVALRELAAVVDGELGHIIGREIVTAVDDAVIYDDFADGVEGGAVAEAVPTGTCYDVLHGQSVEVSLHGVVVGGNCCTARACTDNCRLSLPSRHNVRSCRCVLCRNPDRLLLARLLLHP